MKKILASLYSKIIYFLKIKLFLNEKKKSFKVKVNLENLTEMQIDKEELTKEKAEELTKKKTDLEMLVEMYNTSNNNEYNAFTEEFPPTYFKS